MSQCRTLRAVIKGATKATYTKKNAQFHWGVSAPKQWSLYDVKKDPACENNLADQMSPLVVELSQAYEDWWREVLPEMIAAGGDGAANEE